MTMENIKNINRDRAIRISIGTIICMLLIAGSALGAGFHVPITVGAAGFERFEKPVDVSINFTQLLSGIGQTGTVDENSIHVAETNSAWTVIDASVPSQFDKDAGYDPATKASGTVVFIMKGTTLSSANRYYYVYFDLIGGSSSPVVTSPQITLTDGVTDQGQSSYKITAIDSTYYFQKAAGGFSSWNDKNGNDWIGWNTANGSAGKYRGIPNAVNPEEVFHPGFYCCTSTIVSKGPIKIRIKSVNGTKWESFWDFYPRYATMTMSKVDHNYWFLYEGTPGGVLEKDKDFMVRSNGVKTFLNQSWLGDILDDEWVYFSDPSTGGSGRSLFTIHHEDDTMYEEYWSSIYMTVFGFGRQEAGLTKLLSTVPQHFTIGLVDGTDFSQNSKLINSAYKDLTITKGVAEQDNGDVGPLSIMSSSPVSNPNTVTNFVQTFNINVNKKADIKWSIDGSVVQTNLDVMTSSYTGSIANVGTHYVNATAKNGTEVVSKEWAWTIGTSAATDIQVTNNPAIDRQPAWSPDGQKIAFMTRRYGGWNIATTNIDGSSVVKLPSGLEPSWSPSDRILYSRGTSDPTMDVYIVNNDGSGEQKLTNTYGYDEYPDWNSDITKIAYVSQQGVSTGPKYISIMNTDGSNGHSLGVVGIQPVWSPDKTKIAFKCYLGSGNICVMNADGTSVIQLTHNSGNSHEPDWSPDGARIAYASDKDGDWEIYSINVDGSNEKKLTDNTANDNYPSYSPDGQWIAFSSDKSGNEDIWIMSANSGGPPIFSITSSSPITDPTTIIGTDQIFSINVNKNAGITWSVDGSVVKTDTGLISSYSNSVADVGIHNVNAVAVNGTETRSREWIWTVNPQGVQNLVIVSSLPTSDPSTVVGTDQTFTVNLNKNADITWYVDGSVVKTDTGLTSSYSNSVADVGIHNVNVTAINGTETVSKEWTWTVGDVPVQNLVIVSSLPTSDPSTVVGTDQTFTVNLNKNADIAWYVDGSVVKTDTGLTSSYSNSVADVGIHNVNVTAVNGTETVSKEWIWTVDPIPTIIYVPPAPIISSVTTGNFWVRYILQPGIGENITDSYNVDANGVLSNGTTNTEINITVGPHGKGKIIAYAYNNSGGTSLTPVIQETQVPNNIPIQQGIGNIAATVGVEVTFTVSATDTDSDLMAYNTSATKGTLDPVSGIYSWTPDSSDAGDHTWSYCSKDSYGGIACEMVTVTVSGTSLLSTNITDPKQNGVVSFVNNIIQGKVTGTNLKSAILKIRNGANVVTGSYNLTLVNTKFAQRVEYSPGQKNTLELIAIDSTDNISKASMTINVGSNTFQSIRQVNISEPATINAKNETGTEIVFVPNVTRSATFILTADTNIAEIAKLNNVTSNNSETALGRIVDIQVNGLDATNETDVQSVIISMYYTKKDLDIDGDGVVETGELDENKMSFYWYDVGNNSWKKLSKGNPQWVIDSGIVKISGYNAGYAWIKVRHLSKFALATGLVQPTNNGGNRGSGGGGSSSGSNSGGGSNIGSNEDFNNIDARERRDLYILRDVVAQYIFTTQKIPVTHVNITGKENTLETSVLIEALKNTSSTVKIQAPGVVYKNVNIAIGMSSSSISRYIKSITINFRVENSWFDENAISRNDVKMTKWNGKKWEILETSEKMKDESYTYFETQTNGFSSFAIVATKQDVKDGKPATVSTKIPTKIGNNSAKPKAEKTDSTKNTAGFETVIGMMAFVVIYVSLRKKR